MKNQFAGTFSNCCRNLWYRNCKVINQGAWGVNLSIPMVTSLKTLLERYIKENVKEIPIKKIAR